MKSTWLEKAKLDHGHGPPSGGRTAMRTMAAMQHHCHYHAIASRHKGTHKMAGLFPNPMQTIQLARFPFRPHLLKICLT